MIFLSSKAFKSFPVPFDFESRTNSQDWNSRPSILWLVCFCRFYPITSWHTFPVSDVTWSLPVAWCFPAFIPLLLLFSNPVYFSHQISACGNPTYILWHGIFALGIEFLQQLTEKSSNTTLFIWNLLRFSQSDEISRYFVLLCFVPVGTS